MWFYFKIKASYLQTVTGEGDLALQAMVRDPGEEERGEGDNTASSAYAEEGLMIMTMVVVMVMMIEIHMVTIMMKLDDEYCDNTRTSHPPT